MSHKKLEVCRLCGEKSSDYIPIFEDEDNYIPEKISRCLPIIIFPNDNLPSNVCRRCLNYLNISCRLILGAVAVDEILRIQLDEKQKDVVFTDKDVASCEEPQIFESTNIKQSLLKELKRRAIAGPVECDLCDLNFQNVDTFDNHMEQFHFLKWRCNLCDNSFYESNELIAHKTLRHSGNIIICSSCRHTIDRNNKQITNKNVQNNEKIISVNIQNDQIHEIKLTQMIRSNRNIQNDKQNNKQEIIDVTNDSEQSNKQETVDVLNDRSNNQEIIVEKNTQNSTQKIIDEENIQNNQKTEQETIDNINEKEVITQLSEEYNEHKFSRMAKSCKYCSTVFSTKFKLIYHLRKTHRKIQAHECSCCNVIFKNRVNLVKHVQKTHGLEPSNNTRINCICRLCDKKFNTYRSMINHKRMHTGEMPYNCRICHRSFRSYICRWIHVQYHKKGTFVCEHCRKCFSYKRDSLMHISTHLPIVTHKHQCNTCEKKFLRKSQLIIHYAVRPFRCSLCSSIFSQKSDLKRHENLHFRKNKSTKRI